MKQKTAIQELIGAIEVNMRNLPITDRYRIGLEDCKKDAEKLLEKEREQIIDAFIEGIDELGTIYNAGDYYNSKYKQD